MSTQVAVLMGGPSEEHAISLKSGQGVADSLSRRGYRVAPIVIPRAGVEEALAFAQNALRGCAPEVVFIALHGRFGEDGTIQALCESLQLPYVGSAPAASRLGMDKIASRRYFESAGLAVPRWRVIEPDEKEDPRRRVEGWQYPLVAKPSDQGSSIGVSLAQNGAELAAAIRAAGHFSRQVLVEEFIAGREMTVGVLGDCALPVIEIRPHQSFFDFTAKYTSGATDYLVPAPIADEASARLRAAGLRAHQVLGCRHLSRADFILRPDGVAVILEVNTIPGFTPTSLLPKAAACVGIAYDLLCEQLIQMALSSASSRLAV